MVIRRGLLLVIISTLALSSCSNQTINKREPNTSPTSKVMNSQATNKPTPSPTITTPPTLKPTDFSDPKAKYLILSKDLDGFTVSESAHKKQTDYASNINQEYNNCIGTNAPEIAQIKPKEQFDGDRFYHNYLNSTEVYINSILVKSSKPLEDVAYLKENQGHADCLVKYLYNITKKRDNYKVKSNFKSEVLKNENDIVVNKISGSSENKRYEFINLTSHVREYVVQYQIVMISNSKAKDISKIESDLLLKLGATLSEKVKG